MRWMIILLLAGVAGCSSAADQAAKRYENAKDSGVSSTELCDRAEKVAQLFADQGDHAAYRKWKEIADLDCAGARLEAMSVLRR